MSLRLLLDNADPQIWSKWLRSGVFNGITTNPTLLRKACQPCNLPNLKHLIQEAQDLGCKEFHVQAWGSSVQDIAKCGLAIGKFSSNEMQVHVKVPITKTGSEAAKELIKSDISVTFTACYEMKQVLIAASMNASYIAPYLGRINDQGRDGEMEIINMQKILDRSKSPCKILVASIRDINEICHLASQGIQSFTINNEIAEDLFECQATFNAEEKFERDVKTAY